MLNNAQSYFASAPWVAVFPGIAITLAVTSFNFLGDGLRDAFDPRHVMRER
jgi:peptide/nickel transport system permease protein